jgi:hypothetical protein
VFTKYDQFRRDIKLKLEDRDGDSALLDTEVEHTFARVYLSKFRESVPFVRLERENLVNQLACTTLNSVPQGCTRIAKHVPNFLK